MLGQPKKGTLREVLGVGGGVFREAGVSASGLSCIPTVSRVDCLSKDSRFDTVIGFEGSAPGLKVSLPLHIFQVRDLKAGCRKVVTLEIKFYVVTLKTKVLTKPPGPIGKNLT